MKAFQACYLPTSWQMSDTFGSIITLGAGMLSAHFVAVRRLACVLLVAGASACSTAEYAGPIKLFSDSTDAAAQSVRELNTSLANATLNYAVKAAARDPANNHLEVPEMDCGAFIPTEDTSKAVRCRAAIKLKSALGPDVTVQRQHYTDPLGNMVAIMDAIKDYANNLAAVQEDNTVKEVNDSIDKVQASLIELMKASGKNEPPSDLPRAAGEAVKWAFGQYIESVKYRALKDATSAAEKPLSLAAEAFREIDKTVKLELTAPSGAEAFDSRDNMDPKDEGSIRAALAAQNAYDDVLTAPLSPMFDNLVAAHHDLAEALAGTKPLSAREALAKLKDVQKQARALGKIAKDLSAALKKEAPPSS